jgi:hypothetical protein
MPMRALFDGYLMGYRADRQHEPVVSAKTLEILVFRGILPRYFYLIAICARGNGIAFAFD